MQDLFSKLNLLLWLCPSFARILLLCISHVNGVLRFVIEHSIRSVRGKWNSYLVQHILRIGLSFPVHMMQVEVPNMRYYFHIVTTSLGESALTWQEDEMQSNMNRWRYFWLANNLKLRLLIFATEEKCGVYKPIFSMNVFFSPLRRVKGVAYFLYCTKCCNGYIYQSKYSNSNTKLNISNCY